MKKTILLLFFYLLASVSMAQRVAHDHDIQGYRYIDTYNTRVLTPKGSSFPISADSQYHATYQRGLCLAHYFPRARQSCNIP